MAAKSPALEHISQSFKDLAAAATQLNAASDELASAIAPIDTALKKLNLGVTVWHQYVGNQDPNGEYWARRIGYTKLGGKWGVALSEASGYLNSPDEDCEEWLYNDAPRWMRIEAVDHLPALVDALVKKVSKTASDLAKKSEQAKELAATIAALGANAQEKR